ncbi:MAG: hypothetical protein R2824_08465 [Saprospiraceae bacterium]
MEIDTGVIGMSAIEDTPGVKMMKQFEKWYQENIMPIQKDPNKPRIEPDEVQKLYKKWVNEDPARKKVHDMN